MFLSYLFWLLCYGPIARLCGTRIPRLFKSRGPNYTAVKGYNASFTLPYRLTQSCREEVQIHTHKNTHTHTHAHTLTDTYHAYT